MAASYIAAPSLRFNPAGYLLPCLHGTAICALLQTSLITDGQQTAELGSLLGGGTALAGGVSNELAGLCALLGGSQSHDVTLQ